MAKFGISETLQRETRKDDIAQIGISTWTLAKGALKANDIEQAEKLMDQGIFELRQTHDVVVRTTAEWLDYIAKNLGEEHVAKVWGCSLPGPDGMKKLAAAAAQERIYQFTEVFRGHSGGPANLGDLTVVEEADRFVMTHNPCGSGGRVRRTGLYGVTKRAYPWSWGKAGVHYYCVHCCLFWEITATNVCGFPLRIHENVDRPQEPCVQYVYKRPELIPERYFTRLGLKRNPTQFK